MKIEQYHCKERLHFDQSYFKMESLVYRNKWVCEVFLTQLYFITLSVSSNFIEISPLILNYGLVTVIILSIS
ncbi:hypothetical protein [Lederbergia galactosidilytica]|nr:hypothetical protein [Lederbergia galactosidilytica]